MERTLSYSLKRSLYLILRLASTVVQVLGSKNWKKHNEGSQVIDCSGISRSEHTIIICNIHMQCTFHSIIGVNGETSYHIYNLKCKYESIKELFRCKHIAVTRNIFRYFKTILNSK